jgi:hypothetical protein
MRDSDTRRPSATSNAPKSPRIPASRWDTDDAITAVPVLLGTVVFAAAIMCVCQIIVAPIYSALSGGRLALLPWIAVACLLSVGFCATVGFALAWVGEILERRIRRVFVVLAYAGIGAVAFGIWGGTVVPAVFDSIVVPAGGAALSGQSLVAVVINTVVIGALAFAGARLIFVRFSVKWPAVWISIVVELLLAAAGIFFLAQMYSYLY